MKKLKSYFIVIIFQFTAILSASAGDQTDYDKLAADVRTLLEKMVEADTTNPPGNEAKIVKIVADKFKQAGISFEFSEFGPGRANIVARLPSLNRQDKGQFEKAVLIIAHIDVVGTANQKWSVPPHKVTEKNGFLYGRGVEDDLGMAALAVELLIHLKKSGVSLRRDVVVALTGDEESDGGGILHILKKNPASLDAAFAINEGGSIALGNDGKVKYISLQVAEKIYQDYEFVTTGTTGHSSVPLKDNAIYKLSRSLEKLEQFTRPPRLMAATRPFFLARSQVEVPPMSTAMAAVAKATGKLPAAALKVLEADPIQAANLRTTCVATLISGGTRVNALPAEAKANINCRILPDETREQTLKDLQKLVRNLAEVKMIDGTGIAPTSNPDGEAPQAIKRVANKIWPSVMVIPTMSRGATDSKFLRMHGIPSYGINPIPVSDEDAMRAHGIDERIPVGGIKTGAEFLHRFLLDVAAVR